MGKKGGWFAAIKKAFTSGSKDKSIDGPEQKIARDKKTWAFGKQKHAEINLIPLHREPSSVEKILGEAEREQHTRIHRVPLKTAKQVHREPSSVENILGEAEREQHTRIHQVPLKKTQRLKTPAPRSISTNYVQISAVKIQAAYRGYKARRSYRALKAFLRLQRTMRGQTVKRQTANTMRCMQTLVRVQSQIRASRLQMMDSKSGLQHHGTSSRSEMDFESNFRKWHPITHHKEAPQGQWDDSVLTKEEIEVRMQRKVEAVIKRERALAYAYSHQLLKVTPKSAQAMLTDLRSGNFPWWWTWLERQIPPENQALVPVPASTATHAATPTRPSGRSVPAPPDHQLHLATAASRSSMAASPMPKHPRQDHQLHLVTATPRSSVAPSPLSKQLHSSHQRRTNANPNAAAVGLRDDASLTSCPAFTGRPNYMAPTASAAAKIRAHHGSTTSGQEKKKRFSFALGQSLGSLFAAKETSAAGGDGRSSWRMGRNGSHRSTRSIGELSVDSSMSLPVGSIGRRYFS